MSFPRSYLALSAAVLLAILACACAESSAQSAVCFSKVELTITLFKDGSAKVSANYVALNNGSYPISAVSVRLDVSDLGGLLVKGEHNESLTYSLVPGDKYFLVNVHFGRTVSPGESYAFTLYFTSSSFVRNAEGASYFDMFYTPLHEISLLRVTVYLPLETVLSTEHQYPVFPEPTDTGVDVETGRSYFVWEENDVSPYETLNYRICYEKLSEKTLSNDLLPYLALGAAVAAVAVGLVAFRARFSRRPKLAVGEAGRDAVLKVLEERGEVSQKELVKLTGFSKAKLSLVLKQLEQEGVVERYRIGRQKVVKLKKWKS